MSDRLRVVVTRGDRFDVAEWSPDDGSGDAERRRPPSGARRSPAAARSRVVASLLVVIGTVVAGQARAPALAKPLVPTVADLAAVHAGVSAAGADVQTPASRSRSATRSRPTPTAARASASTTAPRS